MRVTIQSFKKDKHENKEKVGQIESKNFNTN